ncbi:kinase-like protein [Ceratobasidium sp. AG-I]|nr:kinase-like protein [Ceratobasidium sp. AG-I]
MSIPRESTWITNGIWGVISRCWILDPLLRPDAAGFLQTLKELEGKTQNWLPIDVKDLAGKVKRVYNSNYEVWIATYDTFWKQALGFKRYTNHYVRMDLLRSTYSAGWFSKTVPVAVKQPENMFHQPESIRHFKTEAYLASIRNEVAITAQLDHPNICKLLGIDSSNPGAPAMVFDYHSDLTLEKLLGERKPHFTEGLVIIEGLLSALEYMHGHQNGTVVHGDICAHNVYLTDDGLAKLSNFTSACQYVANEAEGRNTPFSSVVSGISGPTRWKSPEFYLNKGREDIPRPTVPSDLWSFGCLVMNILAGAPPYASANDAVAVAQMNAGVAPFSSEQYSEIDERTLALLKPLLSLDPAERPLAGQLLKELHSL